MKPTVKAVLAELGIAFPIRNEITVAKALVKAREERDEARAAFDTVLSLAPIDCDRLHHTKKDYHKSGEPCPVEARIKTLIQITQEDA
jgi:hypothetical protein